MTQKQPKRSRHKQPAPEKKRLFNIVSIEFRTNFLKVDYNAQELLLEPGDDVIVETSRGPVIAKVIDHVQRKYYAPEGIYNVLRRASAEDLRRAQLNERQETDAYRFALERIRARRLPMKLIRAQYMQDESKIVFFFSADGRIDFRELVKDLAHRFRTRIEMHQIGVRDGARMLGGIGPCGRELCCSTFLEHFAPVSIRMAKDQGLTLNPKKVSGMCGRLMCCLVYEQQLYKKLKRRLPRPNTHVFTSAGPGEILSIDIINARALVQLEDGNRKTFEIKEITTNEPTNTATVDDASAQFVTTDFMWDDVMRDYDLEHSEAQDDDADAQNATNEDNSKRRRRSRRKRVKDSPEQAESTSTTQNEKSKRRRPRRRNKPKTDDKPKDVSNAKNQNQQDKDKDKPKRRRRRRSKPKQDGASNKKDGNKQDNASKKD